MEGWWEWKEGSRLAPHYKKYKPAKPTQQEDQKPSHEGSEERGKLFWTHNFLSFFFFTSEEVLGFFIFQVRGILEGK